MIPTEAIGSIPRPPSLIAAIDAAGDDSDQLLAPLYEEAIRQTIQELEATGSPVVTDGEQRKYHNFWTYSVHGLSNTAPDGFTIRFAAGHSRRMPRLTSGPFRYRRYADEYLEVARRFASRPVKQAVISPSALSLMYPEQPLPGYSRDQFIDDLLRESELEIRRCLEKGACKVQVDFTEGRLAMKIDPTSSLLQSLTTSCSGGSPLPSGNFSASTRAPVATGTRLTARRSTTRSSCPACSSSWSGIFTSRWRARRIAGTR